MNELVRLGSLLEGDTFKTSLTSRTGEVVEFSDMKEGVRCLLFDPVEQRIMHPNVMVYVAD
jgi:hypothetical protein